MLPPGPEQLRVNVLSSSSDPVLFDPELARAVRHRADPRERMVRATIELPPDALPQDRDNAVLCLYDLEVKGSRLLIPIPPKP